MPYDQPQFDKELKYFYTLQSFKNIVATTTSFKTDKHKLICDKKKFFKWIQSYFIHSAPLAVVSLFSICLFLSHTDTRLKHIDITCVESIRLKTATFNLCKQKWCKCLFAYEVGTTVVMRTHSNARCEVKKFDLSCLWLDHAGQMLIPGLNSSHSVSVVCCMRAERDSPPTAVMTLKTIITLRLEHTVT